MKRSNRKPSDATPPARSALIPKAILIGAGMVLMLLLEALFWPSRGLLWKQLKASETSGSKSVPATGAALWGQLEYTPIALDRPEEYFTNDFSQTPPPTLWIFRNHTAQQLQAVLATFEFSDTAKAWLTNQSNWIYDPRAIVLQPPAEVVLSLSPATRKAFYALLAQNPENVLHVAPFQFRPDGFDAWFAECGLSSEKISLVRRLTYERNGMLCFSDTPAFSQVATAEERKKAIQCLWRVSTFVAKLRITPQTNVEQLMKYWGRLGPAHEYKPLIESMTRVPEGATINLSYLLPPFARLRLYTYPNPRDPEYSRQDCFWSAMNFFNQRPDNRFFNSDETRKVLDREYSRVRDDSRQFGDLLLLVSSAGQALHMCVYIADDIVFTKNGANTQQPWVLMKLPEMLGQYEKDKPFELRVFRREAPVPLGSVREFSATERAL